MTPDPVSVETVYAVQRTLREHGIEHTFVGGLALSAWAIPRATFDLDLVVALPGETQQDLLASLGRLGWTVEEIFERGWRDRMAGIPVIHVQIPAERSLIRVDLLIAETPFLQSVLARKVGIDLGQGAVPVCTAADLFLFKLLAWRKKDQVDVENLLWMQGVPDRSYVEDWARRLRLEDRLREAIAGA